MRLSRRGFVSGSVTAAVGARIGVTARPSIGQGTPSEDDRFEPWLEVDPAAIAHNTAAVGRLSGGRPVLAVVKNNAYGLGLALAGPVLERAPEVSGFAVVKPEEARALLRAGVRKPILLMARTTEEEAAELSQAGVRLSLVGDDSADFCAAVARRTGKPVAAHLYLDTGMGRMGLPVARAPALLDRVVALRVLRLEGAFTELTEDVDFDREQVARLTNLAKVARERGVALGPLHAASSMAVMHQPEAHLDMVRPGFALYGGYVTKEAMDRGQLRAAFRLRARVARVERVEAGEGVSYHRRWRAERPTWVALLPVGHADGYPASAVRGCEVLVGGRLYRVIGTVSASHTILEIGAEPTVRVGDQATLIGPDDPAIHPNVVAERAGYSEYGVFMHLNPGLPRRAATAS